jgi:hypothetical protein
LRHCPTHNPRSASTICVAVNLKPVRRLGNYDTGFARSKNWDEFAVAGAPTMDFVFTVCDIAAAESCPVWPGQPMTAQWGIPDPATWARTKAVRSIGRMPANVHPTTAVLEDSIQPSSLAVPEVEAELRVSPVGLTLTGNRGHPLLLQLGPLRSKVSSWLRSSRRAAASFAVDPGSIPRRGLQVYSPYRKAQFGFPRD